MTPVWLVVHPRLRARWRAPVLSFVVLAVAGLALAVAIASVPGLSASRVRPAEALRAE